MIEWKRVEKDNPPEGNFIFWFDGGVYDGWALNDEKDDEGYPLWEQNEGPKFYAVRWYAKINAPREV